MIKRSLFTSILLTSLISYHHMTYADILIYSSNDNVCNSIAGSWIGDGAVKGPLVGQCLYHGSGSISNVDAAGNFNLNLQATKTSGSLICPQNVSPQLSGICINGATIIRTQYGNLTGTLSGRSGHASGTLTLSPGVKVDVEVTFHR